MVPEFLTNRPKAVAFTCTLLLSATCFYIPAMLTQGISKPTVDLAHVDANGLRVVQVEEPKAAICAQPPAPIYDVATINANIETLFVHELRIEAEIQGHNFVLPAQLQSTQGPTAATQAFAEERVVFLSRIQTLAKQIEVQKAAAAQSQREIDIMKSKAAVVERQAALLRQRLANIVALAGRGVVAANEKMVAEQNVAQIEIVAYDLQLAIAKAQAEKQTAERNVAELVRQRQEENALELVQTKSKLASLTAQAAAAAEARKGADEMAQKLAAEGCDRSHISSYVIMRGPGGTMQVVKANGDAQDAQPAKVILSRE